MELRRWGRGSSPERLLRASRPKAPEAFVRQLADQAAPARPTRTPRLALAGVATVTMLVGLAAVGGVGRAANEIAHIASVATGHTNYFGKKLAVAVNTRNAANDEYGGQQTSSSSQTTTASSDGSGSVNVTSSDGATVTLSWPAGTFTPGTIIVADPAPPSVTSTALAGENNQVINVIATDSSGNAITTFTQPLAVTVSSTNTTSNKQYVPVFSTDGGQSFTAIPLIGEATNTARDGGAPTLPAGWTIGYYVDSNGHVVVLTTKPALLGVVYSANVTNSETGRKTPQAGSGKFGDPTRNHTGAPALKQVGSVTAVSSGEGTKIPFSFDVDEQAAVYISVYDAKGNAVWIDRKGTTIRGHSQTGKPVHSLHLVILRPGQINTLLKIPAGVLTPGKTYRIRITAIDYDGHKVTEYTSFTA